MSGRLDAHTALRKELAVRHPSGKIVCLACAHRCKLKDAARGVCLVRSRQDDALRVPWGYTAGIAVDPIEKKPFFHFLPGSRALSFGMLGCDLHCSYCQNWFTSQALRNPAASRRAQAIDPDALVETALEHRCTVVTSTYNEPLITAEWAHDVFSRAHRAGLLTSFVSNGHATPEVLDYLAPVIDAYKVDLKTFSAAAYRSLGGKLDAVLDTVRGLVARGIWTEVVTLVVPGFNDSDAELRDIASFLHGISPDIPWHVTAYHPDYEMQDPPPTPTNRLVEAAHIGRQAGLRFVYAGNVPAAVDGLEDTRCPQCGADLVTRRGFLVRTNRLGPDGQCPSCGMAIPGCWSPGHPAVAAGPPPTT